MKTFLLSATFAIPAVASAQQPVALALQGKLNITELVLPKRAPLYTQLSDTSQPKAATRRPYRLVVYLVQPTTANWLLVSVPNHHHCKVGVTYPPDPTYYISKETAAKAKSSILL